MIERVTHVEGVRVVLNLSGDERPVRQAVDAFFEKYDPYAYDARMTRAHYSKRCDGSYWLSVRLTRNITFHPRYRRDYGR